LRLAGCGRLILLLSVLAFAFLSLVPLCSSFQFWTYSVAAADGSVVECSTPIQTITPADVTHEVNI